jgi:hypothetical protein
VLRDIPLRSVACRVGARIVGLQEAVPGDVPAERLAEARGETVDQVRKRFSEEEIARCPRRFSKHLAAVRGAKLVRTGIRDGFAFAELDNGRVFYSFVSQRNHRNEYRYVADTLSDAITEETYLAAIDVVQRYLTDYAWPSDGLVPQGSANIIELGAYLGHKTIRFAEELAGEGGRILAAEMMPENAPSSAETSWKTDSRRSSTSGMWASGGRLERSRSTVRDGSGTQSCR